jgi:hypothetical protein
MHGRLRAYSGDGNVRLWHIGTHHMFEPDETTIGRAYDWLTAGMTKSDAKKFAYINVDLYGDFTVCPVEPFKQGSVQHARIISVANKHYVRLQE